LTVYEVVTGFLHLYVSAGWVVQDTAFPVLQRPVAYALTVNCQQDHMVSVKTIICDQSINQQLKLCLESGYMELTNWGHLN